MADGGSLGEAFVEIVAETGNFESDLQGKLNKAGAGADRASKSIGQRITSGIGGAFRKLPVGNWMSGISSKVQSTFSGMGQRVVSALGPIGPAVQKTASVAGRAFQGVGRGVSTAFSGVSSVASKAMGKIGPTVSRAASSMRDSFVNMANDGGGAISRTLGGALSRVRDLAGTIGLTGVTAGVGALGVSAVKTASSLQSTEAALTGMYGSGDQASQMMDRLNATFGDSAVAGVDAFADVTQQLAWAGAEGDKAVGIMENLETALMVAGGGAEEMNSVSAALGKMANEGQATAETINMISESGVPIWDMLADKIGTDVPDAMSKVSEGAIGVEDVMNSLEAGGGKFFSQMEAGAEQSSQTLSAQFTSAKNSIITAFSDMAKSAMDSMGPALANAGEALGDWVRNVPQMLSQAKAAMDNAGITDALVSAFDGVKSVIAGLTPAVKTFATTLGGAFGAAVLALQPLGSALQSVGGWLQQNQGLVEVLGTALGGAAVAYTTLRVAATAYAVAQRLVNAAMKANPLGLLVTAIGVLVAGFIHLWNTSEGFRNFWIGLWNGIQSAVSAVVSWFQANVVPTFQAVVTWIQETWNSFSAWWSDLWNGQIGGVIRTVLNGIWITVQTVFQQAVSIIQGAMQAIWGVIQGVWSAISGVVSGALNAIRGVIQTVMGVITGNWTAAWNGLKNVLSGVWSAISGVVSGAIQALSGVISGGLNAIKGVFSAAWNGIKALVTNAWNGIKNAVSSGVSNVISAVQELPSRIKGFFADAGSWLLDAGKNIISGLVDGIKSMIGSVTDAIGDVAGKVRDFLPFSPAKEGPLSGSGAPEVSGERIAQNLAAGMARKSRAVTASMRSLASAVAKELPAAQARLDVAAAQAPRLPRGVNPDLPAHVARQRSRQAQQHNTRQVTVNAPITVDTRAQNPHLVAKRVADRLAMSVQA